MNLLNKACFLDSRFRSLSFLTAKVKEVITDVVLDEVLMANQTTCSIYETIIIIIIIITVQNSKKKKMSISYNIINLI